MYIYTMRSFETHTFRMVHVGRQFFGGFHSEFFVASFCLDMFQTSSHECWVVDSFEFLPKMDGANKLCKCMLVYGVVKFVRSVLSARSAWSDPASKSNNSSGMQKNDWLLPLADMAVFQCCLTFRLWLLLRKNWTSLQHPPAYLTNLPCFSHFQLTSTNVSFLLLYMLVVYFPWRAGHSVADDRRERTS